MLKCLTCANWGNDTRKSQHYMEYIEKYPMCIGCPVLVYCGTQQQFSCKLYDNDTPTEDNSSEQYEQYIDDNVDDIELYDLPDSYLYNHF